jgi:hypothetical protein
MSFNASKCSAIPITRKHNKISYDYKLHDTTLERVDSATYLGVELASDLTWSTHINKTVAKANKQLSFVKRNLPINNSKVKETAYKGLVRPILDYSGSIWDPYQKKYINKVEMVQRRAARFVMNRYHNRSSVSEMLEQLKWESLVHRRAVARIKNFFKIQNCLIAVPIPSCMIFSQRPRPGHPHQYLIPHCNTESYRQSFFPRALRQWNGLPVNITSLSSIPQFSAALPSHSF